MNCNHWVVTAPDGWARCFFPYDEATPYWEGEAPTRREALKQAIKDRSFLDYASEMRGDNKPPWYRLVAGRGPRCEHGVCVVCDESPDLSVGFECDKCELEYLTEIIESGGEI